MTEYTSYFNGEWVPLSQVKIDSMDRGFTSADTVFDAGRTYDGKGLHFKRHIDRFYRSLKYARIDPGLSSEEMLGIWEEVVQRSEHLTSEVGDFGVFGFVTRGPGRWASTAGPATVGVRLLALDFNRWSHLFSEGAHGVIAKTRSYPSSSLDSKIKHYSRMNFNMAELEAADVDPEAWPILLDTDGNITEGTTNNVFVVSDGVIRSPRDTTTLQGVSRGMVFDLARQLNIPLVEEDLQPYDLYTADEAFFTNSGFCVLPMTRVDNRQVADGKSGPLTQQLLAAWGETVGIDIVDQAARYAAR